MKNNVSLVDLGYSKQEQDVYLSLLMLGQGNILDISKKTNIKRTSVYPIISRLLEDGIIQKTKQGKKIYYFVDDVKYLQKKLEEKQHIVNLLLPQLEALHNVLPQKPKITYYEGSGGMKDFYFHILDSLSSGEEIYEYIGSYNFDKDMPVEFDDFYPKERVKRKIKIKTIASFSDVSKKWQNESKKFLREVKLEKNGKTFSSNIQIYKNGVGIISYSDNFMGVIIESRDISQMFCSMFELIWNAL